MFGGIQERGALKEIEFNKKMEQYLLEKEKIQPASSFSAVSHVVWVCLLDRIILLTLLTVLSHIQI